MSELALEVLAEARRQKAENKLRLEVIQFLLEQINKAQENDGFYLSSLEFNRLSNIEARYGRKL